MKTRMSMVDCRRMVLDLEKKIVGMWVHNVYDITSKTFQFKLSVPGKDKVQLLIESGVRFHTTKYVRNKSSFPSGFSIKLRKHIRGKKLSGVRQVGVDRVVVFTFGFEQFAYHLIVELYASGNVILTDSNYLILTTLRTHAFDDETRIAVRETYPFDTLAQGIEETSAEDVLGKLLEVAKQQLSATKDVDRADEDEANSKRSGKGKKKARKLTLKQALMKVEAFQNFGKDLLEHALLSEKLDPDLEITLPILEGFTSGSDALQRITKSLNTARDILYNGLSADAEGVVVKRQGSEQYESFQPFGMLQFASQESVRFPDLDAAVDEYFSRMETQKDERQGESAKRAAEKKLEKVKIEQRTRVEALQRSAEAKERMAEVLSNNIEVVENALLVVRSALANSMSWEDLEKLVKAEQAKENPVAKVIASFALERNEMTLLLDDYNFDTDEQRKTKVVVDITQSAYANISALYDDKKKAEFKAEKTIETSEKVIELAQKKAEASVMKQQQSRSGIEVGRRVLWFEKFNWCLTREGVLVLCGRDAHQNEILVKRYLRKSHGDVYVHADMHGAPSCIVRNPRKGTEISPESLREAGVLTICRSSAWTSKVITSAWWVYADQVSKTAPTGEYLPTGSFMIRGKKNFLPPCRLELSFGYIFKIDETLPEAKSRSSDWRLLQDVAKEAVFDSKLQDAIQRSANKLSVVPSESSSNPPKAPTEVPRKPSDNNKGVSTDTKKTSNAEAELPEDKGKVSLETTDMSSLTTGAKSRLPAHERRALRKNAELGVDEPKPAARHEQEIKAKKPAAKQQKRGRRGKEKKKKKYAEQTEEERKLAMAALGNPIEKEETTVNENGKQANEHEAQQKRSQQKQKQRRIKDMEELDPEDMDRLNTSEFNHRGFTFAPKPEDSLLYALPVCGPTSSMLGFKFRVKLLPGSTKKGKAAKTAVELFSRLPNCTERERGLLRAVQETNNIQTMVGGVKLSAPGINSASKASKAQKKGKAKSKAKSKRKA